jgi:hypothetical protein
MKWVLIFYFIGSTPIEILDAFESKDSCEKAGAVAVLSTHERVKYPYAAQPFECKPLAPAREGSRSRTNEVNQRRGR